MGQTIHPDVIGKLRGIIEDFKHSVIYKDVVVPRDAVLARYQPVFTDENVKNISADEFRSFLLFDNNHHWTGLHRQGPRMCSNMNSLRKALTILLDETRKVAERLDQAVSMVSGMGKNIATAILTIVHPDLYGVWNNRSEANMKQLDLWPNFSHGESFGSRYIKVNDILLQLREALDIDLWTLDALWWYIDEGGPEEGPAGGGAEVISGDLPSTGKEQKFGLERHLHEFLRDNWQHVELGKEWELYKEPGDEEAGYEYPCDVGRIDLLFKHKTEPRWLVVELKRNHTSDQTVGQLLRYIGWVKQHLAAEVEEVHGLIICREADKALYYALNAVSNVELLLYEVEFHLKKPEIDFSKKDSE